MDLEKQDRYYMGVASLTAKQSYAIRRKVGAIAVNDGGIIAEGFNGTPSGFDNCCEQTKRCHNVNPKVVESTPPEYLETRWYVLHAESNALMKCCRTGRSTEGSTLYVTASPCRECSKLIIQAGVKRVVYLEEYHDLEGIELLKKAGIEVISFQTFYGG